jgi:hypothetical protein
MVIGLIALMTDEYSVDRFFPQNGRPGNQAHRDPKAKLTRPKLVQLRRDSDLSSKQLPGLLV